MRLCSRIPLCALLSLPVLAPSLKARGEPPGNYVVLMVTNSVGKISYKPIAEKDRASYQKSLDEEYQKAKRAYQEEKKAAEKQKGKGQTAEKSEPVKPKVQIQKRDIKTFNEARKVAFDLERELEQKGKNGKGQKNGNGNGGGEKNGKDKKSGGKA